MNERGRERGEAEVGIRAEGGGEKEGWGERERGGERERWLLRQHAYVEKTLIEDGLSGRGSSDE